MSVVNEVGAKVTRNDNGNVTVVSNSGTQFYFLWEGTTRVYFSEIEERHDPECENIVRAFSITATGCQLQFRAFQSLKGKQKPRRLMATAFIAIEELELLLARMKKEAL